MSLATRVLCAVVLAIGSATVAVVGAAPAEAHNVLISTSPADGATVAAPPSSVSLTFNEPAQAIGTAVKVLGPEGDANDGALKLVNTSVEQPLRADLPAGHYVVDWRVTSADGHPVSGTFSFTAAGSNATATSTGPSATATPLASAASSTAAPSPGAGDSGGMPGWVVVLLIAVAALAVAAAVTFWQRAGRRWAADRPTDHPTDHPTR